MEPLDDKQLKEMLSEWRVPEAPAHLEARVLASREPRWQWFLSGSVSIPVPLLALLLVALAVTFLYASGPYGRKAGSPPGLANFHPVKQVNLRILRSNYEPN